MSINFTAVLETGASLGGLFDLRWNICHSLLPEIPDWGPGGGDVNRDDGVRIRGGGGHGDHCARGPRVPVEGGVGQV